MVHFVSKNICHIHFSLFSDFKINNIEGGDIWLGEKKKKNPLYLFVFKHSSDWEEPQEVSSPSPGWKQGELRDLTGLLRALFGLWEHPRMDDAHVYYVYLFSQLRKTFSLVLKQNETLKLLREESEWGFRSRVVTSSMWFDPGLSGRQPKSQ